MATLEELAGWRRLAIMWAVVALVVLPFLWPASVTSLAVSAYAALRAHSTQPNGGQ